MLVFRLPRMTMTMMWISLVRRPRRKRRLPKNVQLLLRQPRRRKSVSFFSFTDWEGGQSGFFLFKWGIDKKFLGILSINFIHVGIVWRVSFMLIWVLYYCVCKVPRTWFSVFFVFCSQLASHLFCWMLSHGMMRLTWRSLRKQLEVLRWKDFFGEHVSSLESHLMLLTV